MASAGTPISGCVICYQEADRIVDCVRSLAFCDEVVVVDSGSTDGTRELAAGLGARVLVNTPFPGHREQKQFAVEQARHDFVFCLDADERCTPELAAQVRAKAAAGLTADAYEMPRHNHYLGRISKHGLFVPDRKIRLFDRRRALGWAQSTRPRRARRGGALRTARTRHRAPQLPRHLAPPAHHRLVHQDRRASTRRRRTPHQSVRPAGPAAGGVREEPAGEAWLPRRLARPRDRDAGRLHRLEECWRLFRLPRQRRPRGTSPKPGASP